ncbi:MAG: hypothetical protein Q8O22_06925 [Candidatus Omnitrophota bacterium]|nr:hypothetical protein [Candidatus Omnitrophota bacterium]
MKKSILFIIAVNLVFSIVLNPCWASSGRPATPNDAVVISGKITDKATAKPIAGAQISLNVQNKTTNAVSDINGKYSIRVGISLWFRTATVNVSANEYARLSSILLILPGRRAVQKDLQLKDILKPSLEIVSPKDEEEVFTDPAIELKYDDKGSGIDLHSLTISAGNRDVTKYIKNMNFLGALCVIPKNDALAQGECEISARVKDLAGNEVQRSILVTVISKVDQLIRLGKKALTEKNAQAAYDYFKQALDVDPKNKEANFYFGLMRLAKLLSQDEVFAMLQDLGFKGPGSVALAKVHLDPFHLAVETPSGFANFDLPASAPSGRSIQDVITKQILPELNAAIKNLNIALADKNFVTQIAITAPFIGSGKLALDYGDIALIKSTLLLVKSFMHEMLVRDVDIDSAQIKALFAAGNPTIWRLLELYPDLMRVKSVPHSLQAREALVASIDSYSAGFFYIFSEQNRRPDNLLNLSPLPKYQKEALLFVDELKDIKRSLMGTPERVFSLRLNQVINAGNFFTQPFDFRRAFEVDSASYLLQDVFLPYFDYAASNFSKVKPAYREFFPPESSFYTGNKKEIDFTDTSAILSALELSRTGFLSLLAYDLNMDIQTLAPGAPNEQIAHIQDALGQNPRLLYLSHPRSMNLARDAFSRMVKSYAAGADYFAKTEDADQSDDLLTAKGDALVNLGRYVKMLQDLDLMKETLIDPSTANQGDEFRVNLGEFFLRYKDMRALMPQFAANNNVIAGTYPDETFGGILPDGKFNE